MPNKGGHDNDVFAVKWLLKSYTPEIEQQLIKYKSKDTCKGIYIPHK